MWLRTEFVWRSLEDIRTYTCNFTPASLFKDLKFSNAFKGLPELISYFNINIIYLKWFSNEK